MPSCQKSLSYCNSGVRYTVLVLLCSDEPIQILVILSPFQTFRTETKIIRRICMKSLKYKSPYISLPNCNKMLIFGKLAFFIMLFPDILINPTISKIQIFVTRHFRTLFARSIVARKTKENSVLVYPLLGKVIVNKRHKNTF